MKNLEYSVRIQKASIKDNEDLIRAFYEKKSKLEEELGKSKIIVQKVMLGT